MTRFLLNAINIGDISTAWTAHRQRFVHTDDGEIVMEQFEIWSEALKHTLVDTVSSILEKFIFTHAGDDRYCRYVDWITSIGIVPIVEIQTAERMRSIDIVQRTLVSDILSCQLLGRLDVVLISRLRNCVHSIMSHDIPNVPDIRIHRLRTNGAIECFAGKRRLNRYVYAEPMVLEEGNLILTTPLARIRYERMRHTQIRTHRKLCQLLNTHPVKIVTTSRHEMNTKRIIELMEKRDRNVDAKTSIVKFLLNVSDSKSKIGLDDSIESFLQDLTPSVDQNRLMPTRAPIPQPTSSSSGTQDIRELFRRQVIRCLEDQIQDHVEEIENLKLLNKTWEGKTRELRDALDRYESEGRRSHGPPSSDLQTTDTLNALRRAQTVGTTPVTIDDNRLVANSFFSQFVPDEHESEDRLSKLWENEYHRCFRFRRNVNNQGAEDSISYSNYTLERVLLPFLTSVLNFPVLDPIPEEYLFLSLSELADVVYETSRFQRYVDFIRYRETIRNALYTEPPDIVHTQAQPSKPTRFGEPPTKVRITGHTDRSEPSDQQVYGQPPDVRTRLRSPREKLEALRNRRNVQQLDG